VVETPANNAAFASYMGNRSGASDTNALGLGGTVTPLTQYNWASNGSGSDSFTFTTQPGLWCVERTSSGAGGSKLYYNGQPVQTGTNASTALTNKNFLALATWDSGLTTPTLFANGRIAGAFGGSHLGASGQLALYNALRSYMTSVGVA